MPAPHPAVSKECRGAGQECRTLMERLSVDKRKLTTQMPSWLVVVACMLIAVVSCVRESREPVTVAGNPGMSIKPAEQARQFTIFFTGNELGALKPCGCSGGQLGGLDRRPAVFSRVAKESRLIVDTGSLVPSDAEQDLIKFTILNRALDLLDYDVANLSEEDLRIARNQGLLADPGTNFISSYAEGEGPVHKVFRKSYELDGETLRVSIVPFDPGVMQLDDVAERLRPESDALNLNVLIMNRCDEETVEAVKRALPALDCLVCPAEGD